MIKKSLLSFGPSRHTLSQRLAINQNSHSYIYTYIYICVCVCVCVFIISIKSWSERGFHWLFLSPSFPFIYCLSYVLYRASSVRTELMTSVRSVTLQTEPMYGTRPCCLVQAITRHTCPDPHLGSWNCLPHQAHIAPSEPMSSIDQQGLSLGSFPTFPSPLSPL